MLTSQFKSLLDELPGLSPQQLDDLRAAGLLDPADPTGDVTGFDGELETADEHD